MMEILCLYLIYFMQFVPYLTKLFFQSGKGWGKYIIHLLSLLPSTRTHIWCNRIYDIHWHLVSWLCTCWAASGTGPWLTELLDCTSLNSLSIHFANFMLLQIILSALVSWRECSGPACRDYQGGCHCFWYFYGSHLYNNVDSLLILGPSYRFLALPLGKKLDAWILIIQILGFLRLKLTRGTR